MRSCRDITELLSKGMDRKLDLKERLAIRIHAMMCSRCRNFRNQIQFIRKASRRYAEGLPQSLSGRGESNER